jgi:vacuolar-type H+-ATPase subunit F/Vma7
MSTGAHESAPVVVVPPDTAPGFRLAGTRVVVARDTAQARAAVDAELQQGTAGVVAVGAALWRALPAAVRRSYQDRIVPVVLSLPDEAQDAAAERRADLKDLLARSVGYEITFSSEEG